MKQIKNFVVVWDSEKNEYLLFNHCYQFADVVWGGRDRIREVDTWVGGPEGRTKYHALVIKPEELPNAIRAAVSVGRTIKFENWCG